MQTPPYKFNQLQQQQFQSSMHPESSSSPSPVTGRHWGNNIILCRSGDGEPWIMLGPHWYIFLFAFLVTVTLIAMLIYSMYDKMTTTWKSILTFCSIIFSYSYLRIGLSYPGFLPQQKQWPPTGQHRICQICHTIKTQSSFHCSDCDVCIDQFDHHCPWIGKCVGSKNLWSFYFFLIMIFGTLVMCFIATIVNSDGGSGSGSQPHHTQIKISG